MSGNQIKRFVDDFPSPQPLCVVIGGVYPSVQVFGMPWQGRQRFSIAHPSIPSRWEGKKYRLSNDLFPLPTGGGEGVGDPIQPSLCSSTDILYAMGIYENCWGYGGCGQRGAHLSPILRSSQYIGELSGMDRLYRTRKRWGMEKGDAGHSVPTKKSDRVDARPGRLNGRRRRGSGRLLEGSHAAQTALAFALRHVTQRLIERVVLAVCDVAAHGVDHLGADIGRGGVTLLALFDGRFELAPPC